MSLPRIIDSNANRAREALRVMEDAARFAVDDAALTGSLKSIRHDLRVALDQLPPGWLEAHRNVAGDVGTRITTAAEGVRTGHADVVAAAGKRLGEALRSIEEAAKVVDDRLAPRVEALRYRAYEAEAALNARLASGRARQWPVCVLLTESLCARPWPEVVEASIDGGATCIQVREKELDGANLAARVRAVLAIARPAGVTVIVNDRVDVALAAGADGVHLGVDDLPIADVRRVAGRALLVGASTHDLDEAATAVAAGADYCGVGAMFRSPAKPHLVPSGPAYLHAFVERFPDMPHLAIGGIGSDNVSTIADAGGRGVAVSSAVCGAADPAAIVRALRDALPAVARGSKWSKRQTTRPPE
jgi:thiamine-phosphate pyrophosphorylase